VETAIAQRMDRTSVNAWRRPDLLRSLWNACGGVERTDLWD